MGVAGSGKTTVGRLLAAELGWNFIDADDFHSEKSIAKMTSGVALTDTDRGPWLARLSELLAARTNIVLACSALKRSYRTTLSAANPVQFIYLKGKTGLIETRLRARAGHFASAALLPGQFRTLEEPTPTEALTTNIELSPEEIVREILTILSSRNP